MATATWFVRAEGKVRGPFEAIHLHRLVQRGQLAWHHELSEDRRQWVKAQDHPMFEGLAPKPEPPVMNPVPIALPVYSGPPPLPLCAPAFAPPAFAPAAYAPPDNTPVPPPPPTAARTGTDWVEQGKDVAERLMKKLQRQPGRQPQEAALELPELGETPTVYSLDLEDTSVDINVSDAAEAARGWFDDFDLGSWTETFS